MGNVDDLKEAIAIHNEAYKLGRRSILDKLENPSEEMVEAVLDVLNAHGSVLVVDDICRALAAKLEESDG